MDPTQWIRETACSSDVATWYPVERIVWQGRTTFQDVTIADVKGFGRCLFLDDEIQSSTYDEDMYHECLVHPAMLTAVSNTSPSSPLRILVIGGGEGATVREVLRWADRVGHVTWVDIDGELVKICREHLGWAPGTDSDPRVSYLAMDIRLFFESCRDTFDVIIVDLPDPDPAGDDLQDAEFWSAVVGHLKPITGVCATHVGPVRRPGYASGMSYTLSVLGSGAFKHRLPYHVPMASFQDDWGFLLMSDTPPDLSAPLPDSARFLTPAGLHYIFAWP